VSPTVQNRAEFWTCYSLPNFRGVGQQKVKSHGKGPWGYSNWPQSYWPSYPEFWADFRTFTVKKLLGTLSLISCALASPDHSVAHVKISGGSTH